MSQWARENPELMEEIARLPVSQQNEALRGAVELPEEFCAVCGAEVTREQAVVCRCGEPL